MANEPMSRDHYTDGRRWSYISHAWIFVEHWNDHEEVAALRATIQQQAEQIEELEGQKDGAYLERNQVVAALSKCFPSGVAKTAIDGWSEDWHGCVYINLPTGQVSWHYHDSHAHLFAELPPYTKPWDGHTTEEKYQRLANLQQAEQREQRLRAAVKDFVDSFERDHVLDGRLVDFPRIEHVRLYRAQKAALAETAHQAEPSPSPQGGDAPHRER